MRGLPGAPALAGGGPGVLPGEPLGLGGGGGHAYDPPGPWHLGARGGRVHRPHRVRTAEVHGRGASGGEDRGEAQLRPPGPWARGGKGRLRPIRGAAFAGEGD